MMFMCFLASLMTGLVITGGCTKQNLDQLDLEHNVEAVNAFFPHPKNWKGQHMTFVVSRTDAAKFSAQANDARQDSFAAACDQCHAKTSNIKGKPRNVGCATACHTKTTNGEPIHFPKLDDNKCVACHSNVIDNKYSHYPAGIGSCETCHTADADHLAGRTGKVTTNKKVTNCYKCHSRMDDGPVLHGALKDDEACISCHNPHGSNSRYFIKEEKVSALCNTCHSVGTESGSKHAPAVQGRECLNCHNPHSSQNKKLLLKPQHDLCLSCHDRPIQGSLNGARTIPNIKAKIEAAYPHKGALGDCTDCHDPHASDNKRLLLENYSLTNYNTYPQPTNPYAACFTCHSDSMLNETDYADSTNFRDTAKGMNYHWYHVVDAAGNTDKTRGRSCKICHDPHGSEQPFHINPTWRMNEGNIHIEYTLLTNGGQCAKTCHTTHTYQR